MGSGYGRWVLPMAIGGATNVRLHPQTIPHPHWRSRQMTWRMKSLMKRKILHHTGLIHCTINWLRILSVSFSIIWMPIYTKSMWVLCSPSLMIWITHGSLLISGSRDRNFLIFCARTVNNLRRMAMIRLRVSVTVCLSTLSSAILALCEFTDTHSVWWPGLYINSCVGVFLCVLCWAVIASVLLRLRMWHSFWRTNAIQITALVPEAQAIEIAAFLKKRVMISGHPLCFWKPRHSYMFLCVSLAIPLHVSWESDFLYMRFWFLWWVLICSYNIRCVALIFHGVRWMTRLAQVSARTIGSYDNRW